MARILILSLVFAPDGVSTAVIVSELAQDLQAMGHRLTVLTTAPHYNLDAEARARQPLRRRWGGLFYRSDYHGVPVWHTAMPCKGGSALSRARDYLIFHAISLWLGIAAVGRQDVVFAVSPPLTIGVIGWLLARVRGARLVYNVQELYPDAAVKVGVLRAGSRIVRVLERVERFVYRRAHALAVICEPFAKAVTKKGIDAKKVHKIPNFVDVETIRPGTKDNALARELGLVARYVVLYAGNIGMTQSFDTLLEAAGRLRDAPDVHFLIVGDGVRRAYVAAQVRARALGNVTLLPYQPRSRVPDIYAAADLGLVPLMAGAATATVPSKLYTIMASARPALVAADAGSELVKTVRDAQCGLSVPPDDADALEAGIRQAYARQDQFRAFGANGRRYVAAHFSRRAVSAQYHALFEALAADR
ncbi:MAG: glycosyltransferase [Anaerolineae bacterium]